MISTVHLVGRRRYGQSIPPEPVGHLLVALPGIVRQSTAMAFQRRSRPRGRPPRWLIAASDIRVVDVSGEDDTVIRFDVPRLGDVAGDLYSQSELFPSRPDPDDTGFDLLGDVLRDVAAGSQDSDRFDSSLLQSIAGLDEVLGRAFEALTLSAQRYLPEHPVVVDRIVTRSARDLLSLTPPATRVRVVGVLDAVRISTQTFGLRLDDGHEIRGVFSAGEFDRVLRLLQSKQRVVVRGDAMFRPSGQLLLVDADDIDVAAGESSIWSRIPQAPGMGIDAAALRRRQGPKSGLAAIIGQWPGNETDEEVAEALRALS